MKKKPYKSLTLQSALVIVLITIMSFLGIDEKEIAKTYDAIGQESKSQIPKELITLIAAGGVMYGRYRVKEEKE